MNKKKSPKSCPYRTPISKHKWTPAMSLFWGPGLSTVPMMIPYLMLCTAMPSAGFEVNGGSVVGVVGEDLVLPCLLQSSTSAVDMEVIWTIGGKIVHHYKNHQDSQDQQLQDYRGRTNLSREELQRGNASLKLASVTHSDADVYMCKIISKSETKEARVSVKVKGFEVVGGSVVGVVGEDLILPCSLKPSTSAVNEEVIWLIGKHIVHQYKRHQDWSDQQLPAYRGRTSLFKDELARGNLSLKITSVNQSDANTYRCFTTPQIGGPEEASVYVRVETSWPGTAVTPSKAIGSTPVISAVNLGNGNVSLECQSEGWSGIPQLEWLDSEGQTLLSEPPYVQSWNKVFRVKSTVTVEEHHGNIIRCRVTNLGHSRETEFKVSSDAMLVCSSHPNVLHHWIYNGVIAILVVIIICLVIYIFKKQSQWKKKHERFEERVESKRFEGYPSQSSPESNGDDTDIQLCNGRTKDNGYDYTVTMNNQPL